jgi:hypothetical protein
MEILELFTAIGAYKDCFMGSRINNLFWEYKSSTAVWTTIFSGRIWRLDAFSWNLKWTCFHGIFPSKMMANDM